MDTDSIIIYIITEDLYKDISDDVKIWFHTSNYDENDKRPLPIGKRRGVYGFSKDELTGNIMKEFIALRAKTYAYLTDDNDEKKKVRETKKCVIKRKLMFANYKGCLFNGEVMLISQQKFKSDHQTVYTEEISKIALSSNGDKRLQTFDGIETYPYGANAFKACKNEMRDVWKAKETLLSKDCENDMYVTCNIFLKYMEVKCKNKMKKSLKIKAPVAFNV